jgi:hypothetical protein
MHSALIQHPLIYQGVQKEANLRLSELLSPDQQVVQPAALWALSMMTPRFLPNVSQPSPGALILNSRPGTMLNLDEVAAFVPNARIMFALREPASRSLSIVAFRRSGENLPPLNAAELDKLFGGVMTAFWSASLCLKPGVSLQDDGLKALLDAAQLQSEVPSRCLPRNIVPCPNLGRIDVHSGKAETAHGDGLLAVLPLYAKVARMQNIVPSFYLGPLLHAHKLFGTSAVHVHWLEAVKRDTPAVLRNITSFLRIHEFTDPPLDEEGLNAMRLKLRAVTEKPYLTHELDSLKAVSGNLSTVVSSLKRDKSQHSEELLRRLQRFFAPFERVRRVYFALHGLPELPWDSDPRRNASS